jgi:hypothetical protein
VTSAIQTQLNGKQATGNYLTALTSDVSASGPGSASATVNSIGGSTAANVHAAELAANAATSTATASTIAKRNISGQIPYDSLGSLPVTQIWNVDGTRTDTYTADGSIARPYKTIMAAVNAIIANGLNAANHPDVINILTPITYVENVTFNNAALFNIILNGNGATIAASSGIDIDSSATNTQLSNLIIKDLTMNTLNLVGDVNGTNFLSSQAQLVSLFVATSVTIQNEAGPVVVSGNWEFNTTTLQNLGTAMTVDDGAGAVGAFTLTHNNAANKPNGLGASGTSCTFEHAVAAGNVTVSAGATLQFRAGARVGTSGSTCSISGTLIDYGAVYRCNMTINSGGVWTPSGSFLNGTFSNSGTLTAPNGTPYFKSFVGDSGSGGTQGLVPSPSSGDAAANKYLKASGSFSTPSSTEVTNASAVSGSSVTAALTNLSAMNQEVLLVANKNAGSVTANTEIPTWTTVSKDTNSAFNSSTGTFTVPVAGDYRVTFTAAETIGTPTAQVYYNGALFQTGVGSLTRTQVSVVIPNTAVGDTIWVALDTTGTLTSTNTDNMLQIQNLAGNQTGIVNLRYHGATATITSSLSNVTFSTKDFDTNSAYSGATFTAPSAGVYLVRASLFVTATTVAAGQNAILQLNKNGSQYGNYEYVFGAATQKPANLAYSDLVSLAQNDTLVFQVSSTATTAPSISASNFFNFINILKVSN